MVLELSCGGLITVIEAVLSSEFSFVGSVRLRGATVSELSMLSFRQRIEAEAIEAQEIINTKQRQH